MSTNDLAGVFYFTLSLVNAGLAQSKWRSGFGWWLLSLFLGPIATLLIVVLPRPKPYRTNDE
ncbi:hypothetical protein ACWEN6_20390 [Sphaerisporangium sp. NPDC004334]